MTTEDNAYAIHELTKPHAKELSLSFCELRSDAMKFLGKDPHESRVSDVSPLMLRDCDDEQRSRIRKALEQMINCCGSTRNNPIEGLQLVDLFRLMEMIQYRLKSMEIERHEDWRLLTLLDLRRRFDQQPLKLFVLFDEDPEHAPPGGILISAAFGYTPRYSIPCDDVLGELQYLRSLTCPNGHPLYSKLIGSLQGMCIRPGSHESHSPDSNAMVPHCIVNHYETECSGGEHTFPLYFDRYHPGYVNRFCPNGLSQGNV